MAVFRNVMAFLGLDDDDQMYDDETYYEDEDESPEQRPIKGRHRTIAIDDRLPAGSETPSFGFSADSEVNEMGGVGAVRPLRPVPSEDSPPIPESLSGVDRRLHQPDTAGAFEDQGQDSTLDDILGGSGVAKGFDRAPVEHDSPRQRSSPLAGTSTADTSPAGVDPRPDRPNLTSVEHNAPAAAKPSPFSSPEESEPNVVAHAKPRLHIPSSFDDASRIADDFRTGAPVVMNLTKVEKPVARRLVDFASGVCYVLSGGMERVAPNVYLLTPVGVDVSPEDRRRMQERGFDR